MDSGRAAMFRARVSSVRMSDPMYSLMLIAHSWLRWLVLVAALVALARSMGGWNGRRPWTQADDRAGLVFTTALDVQFLIGLLLYFLFSPLMSTIRANAGEAMGDSAMRYWLVEHPFGMLVGIALAHIGRSRIRKAVDAARKHRLTVIFFGLALVAILVSIPWPGTIQGRPLVRLVMP